MLKKRAVFYVLMMTLSAPILFGVNCPNTAPPGSNPVPQTLLQADLALGGPCGAITQCAGAIGGIGQNFSPTQVGKQITVTVQAILSNSQPMIEVQDFNGLVVVASSGINPTTNTTSVTFTSTSTGVLLLQVCECAFPSSSYNITVTQAP